MYIDKKNDCRINFDNSNISMILLKRLNYQSTLEGGIREGLTIYTSKHLWNSEINPYIDTRLKIYLIGINK